MISAEGVDLESPSKAESKSTGALCALPTIAILPSKLGDLPSKLGDLLSGGFPITMSLPVFEDDDDDPDNDDDEEEDNDNDDDDDNDDGGVGGDGDGNAEEEDANASPITTPSRDREACEIRSCFLD
mmetsp:Transcript_3543/g.6609  ORF Transcript_3543/g.6609 Transcript_3543/m.6609 type:complete len:127 (+) Transcript_3543:1179-1559(+)